MTHRIPKGPVRVTDRTLPPPPPVKQKKCTAEAERDFGSHRGGFMKLRCSLDEGHKCNHHDRDHNEWF